jgi:excisionase family DNA binding protein
VIALLTRKAETEKAVYNIYQVSQLLDINLPKTYELAKHPDFPAVRLGKRIIVPRAAFERWLNERAAEPLE